MRGEGRGNGECGDAPLHDSATSIGRLVGRFDRGFDFSNAPREEGGVLGSSWEDKSGDNKRGFPGSILARLKRGAGRAKRLNSCANGN